MTSLIQLQNGPLHLQLAPEIGGAIASFYSEHDGERIDWFRPASKRALTERDVTGMASFPMLPFCGRVRDGQFRAGHQTVQLPRLPGQRHHLHGIGWQLPWQVTQHSDHQATLLLEVDHDQWPYPFQAEQQLRLADNGLSHTLSVIHLGNEPRPYGIGLHPYFPRTANSRLRADIKGIWQTDDDILPTEPVRSSLADQLKTGFDPNMQELDHTSYGWDHEVTVGWGKQALTLYSHSPADFLAIYTPKNEAFFCLEPCSHVPDFPNLSDDGQDQTGGRWLAPGQRLEIHCLFRPHYRAG